MQKYWIVWSVWKFINNVVYGAAYYVLGAEYFQTLRRVDNVADFWLLQELRVKDALESTQEEAANSLISRQHTTSCLLTLLWVFESLIKGMKYVRYNPMMRDKGRYPYKDFLTRYGLSWMFVKQTAAVSTEARAKRVGWEALAFRLTTQMHLLQQLRIVNRHSRFACSEFYIIREDTRPT